MSNESFVTIDDKGTYSIVPGKKSKTIVCIDPRKPDRSKGVDVDPGAIHRVGGALGEAMVLMGLLPQLTGREAVELVSEHLGKRGMDFSWHGAVEAHGANNLGCGHFDKARQFVDRYQLNPERLNEAVGYIDTKLGDSPRFRKAMLLGQHAEEAVAIVNDRGATISSSDNFGVRQIFVYDQYRAEESLRHLSDHLQTRSIHVDYQDLIAESDRQMNLSVGLLAQGLGIYGVTGLSENHPIVNFMGYVNG